MLALSLDGPVDLSIFEFLISILHFLSALLADFGADVIAFFSRRLSEMLDV